MTARIPIGVPSQNTLRTFKYELFYYKKKGVKEAALFAKTRVTMLTQELPFVLEHVHELTNKKWKSPDKMSGEEQALTGQLVQTAKTIDISSELFNLVDRRPGAEKMDEIHGYLAKHPDINTELPLGDSLRTCLHAAAWQIDPVAVLMFLGRRSHNPELPQHDHRLPETSQGRTPLLSCLLSGLKRLRKREAGWEDVPSDVCRVCELLLGYCPSAALVTDTDGIPALQLAQQIDSSVARVVYFSLKDVLKPGELEGYCQTNGCTIREGEQELKLEQEEEHEH